MERATARTIEKNIFMVLQYSLLTGRVRLSGDRRDCVPDRQIQPIQTQFVAFCVRPDKKTINQSDVLP
jgi:hypothetical protein